MPTQVKATDLPERTRQSVYKFEEQDNGEWWKFEQGKDFESKPTSFIGAARSYAGRKDKKLETRTVDGGKVVFLRFVKA